MSKPISMLALPLCAATLTAASFTALAETRLEPIAEGARLQSLSSTVARSINRQFAKEPSDRCEFYGVLIGSDERGRTLESDVALVYNTREMMGMYALFGEVYARVEVRFVPLDVLTILEDDGATHISEEDELNLDLTCGNGNWFVFYEEDENGAPIPGTGTVHCDGHDIEGTGA